MDKGKIILRKCKTIGVSALLFFVGIVAGIGANPTPEGYSEAFNEKEVLVSSIEGQATEIENKEKELKEILSLKREVKDKEDKALVKEKEMIARAEALAREEAERKAKEEAQRLQANAINNSNSNSTSSSGGGSNSQSTGKTQGSGNKVQNTNPIGKMVWKTATGKKYHSKNNCGNTNSANARQVTLEAAKSAGLTPCNKCY